MNNTRKEIINLLNRCAIACDHCAIACLKESDVHHLTECIKLDMICASVCRTTALILESSIQENLALELCIQICKECEEECKNHNHDHCKACANRCNECIMACEQALAV